MLNLIIAIFTSFFKIGLFTLGGGLVIMPLIQQEMEKHNWLTTTQFLDIIGIAQATPGPMGMNTATFVGYRVPSLQGMDIWSCLFVAVVANVAIMLPSVIAVHFAGGWFEKNKNNPWVKSVFEVLRPLVAGFVSATGVLLILQCFGSESIYAIKNFDINAVSIVILIVSTLITFSKNISPLWGLLFGALASFFL